MSEEYNQCLKALTTILSNQEFICTTADAWSCHGVSYMGMTVHFIDEHCKRQSYVLGFEKLKKAHI